MEKIEESEVSDLLDAADKAYLTVGIEEPVPSIGDVPESEREYDEIVETFEISDI